LTECHTAWIWTTRRVVSHSFEAFCLWNMYVYYARGKVETYCAFNISLSKAFLRLLLYSLLFQAETYMICVNVFYVLRNKILVRSDKSWKKIPYTHIVKTAQLGNVKSIDITLPKWAIFTMRVCREILCLLTDPTEILFLGI